MLLKLWCKEKPLTKFMLPLALFVKTCSTELQLLKDLIYRISLHSILKILIEKNIFRRIRVMLFLISCSLDLVCLVLMYSQFILFLEFIVKTQNICNLIGWISVHISITINYCIVNINGMWNARKRSGIYKKFKLILT